MNEIKVVSKSDLNIVQDLAYKIWPHAYKEILSQEQLEYMLNKFYSIDALEQQLLNGHHFILVYAFNKPLGFASYELNHKQERKTKLHKLYVLTTNQSTGLGTFLLEKVCSYAIEANNHTIFLNVNRFNKAIDFYKKNKFIITKEEVIDIGKNFVMDDYVMERRLT